MVRIDARKEEQRMLTGKILKLYSWPEGKIIGLAKTAGNALEAQGLDQETVLARLDAVREKPGEYLGDALMGALARECIRRASANLAPALEELRAQPADYAVWGVEQIDPEARSQMENALRLPVAVAGALMPDAHVGYGLPIGGVLATSDAVIPYAVGVDIACRMRLSVYPVSPHVLGQRKNDFKRSLIEQTRFGMGVEFARAERPTHAVLDDPAWSATRFLKSLPPLRGRRAVGPGCGRISGAALA
jgi:tRNA-splicing ligase RtcB